jgi:50S ribosomal protein L16 3-hydroxylase
MRLADEGEDAARAAALYRDPQQPATATPGALPDGLLQFARRALEQQLADPDALARVFGELLTEPKPQVWFEAGAPRGAGGVRLDARSRMLYDDRHVFINGEALRAGGRDARLMRQLADTRALAAADCARLSAPAAELLDGWLAAGWLRQDPP